MQLRWQQVSITAFSFFTLAAPTLSFGQVSLIEGDWKVKMGGFIEFDSIVDSTRSLTEVIGNNPVDRPGTANGSNGRTQFSIRNSRLAFSIEPPKIEGEWNTRGYIEFDLLGFDPNPSGPGSTAGSTESGYFNNPTLRVRHAYLQATHEDFDLIAGQTWQILGWQPYYFLNTVNVAPLPGMLYNRTTQVRGVKRFKVSEDVAVQAALGILRPPQRDSSYPALEGGLRITSDARKSGFNGGSTGAQIAQPMSLAISGTVREFETPTVGGAVTDNTYSPGSAIAIDGLLPLLASPDGKSTANTLSLVGEFSTGTGYGDQFSGWSGNISSPLNASKNALATNINLDAGLGDYDASGSFHLIHLMSWNVQLQYNLSEESKSWFTLGHSELYSNNISSAVDISTGKVAYDRDSSSFINFFHDFTKQLRIGVEYDYVRTHYVDSWFGHDNRYMASAWFMF